MFRMLAGLIVIAAAVTLLPLLVKQVGQELELFLFLVGAIAVTVTSQWSVELALHALQEPFLIAGAVLAAGLLFHFFTEPLEKGISRLRDAIGLRAFGAGLIVLLGILSSLMTAIMASLILVESVRRMKLDRAAEVRVIVLACFSIGLGAALTPFGEPLATVTMAKLSGEPLNAGFWFLLRSLWMYIIPGIAALGAAGAFLLGRLRGPEAKMPQERRERLSEVFLRTLKVYAFVVGLVLLGTAFTPIINRFIGSISWHALYWVNVSSALLDNATLAAAEIVPAMDQRQIVAALLALLVAGGMLVPGNIPNIIAAGRLKIDARGWARFGVPVGLAMMSIFFIVLLFVR